MNNKLLCKTILTLSILGITCTNHSYAENLITNGDFSDGDTQWQLPAWWTGGNGSSDIDDQGRLCISVSELGTSSWGAQLRQDNLNFLKGETYKVSMTAWVSTPMEIRASAVDESDGYIWIFGSTLSMTEDLESEGQKFNITYTASNDSTDNGMFRFLLGAGEVPIGGQICLDDIVIDGYKAEVEAINIKKVHINQIGYLPYASKKAVYTLADDENDIETPREWKLLNGDSIVATGSTIPNSNTIDPASGDLVHTIDFSTYEISGVNYTLSVVDGDTTQTSDIFPISDDIYNQVKYDALAYFYHNRSGIAVEADVVGEDLARPIGHESDSNTDTTSCLTDSSDCTSVDVSGGWYDAGDHGKYVVNGGVSTWTLLNLFERFKYLGNGYENIDDGTMALPSDERANGIPDILDEAKWEIEWFLKMQVASDQPLAGMVYHKIHDDEWTGFPLAPGEDLEIRHVHPVSTAATLNFAAIGAQCYRIYVDIDNDLAERCLEQAEIAYAAALNNPAIYASEETEGGGAYEDTKTTDEFYWAATELYISTEKQSYSKDMQKSPLHLWLYTSGTSLFNWQTTNALAIMSIATARNPAYSWTIKARALIVEAADQYTEIASTQGYGVPFDSNYYVMGSNASVVNNMMVLGLAYDFTQNEKYIDAMLLAANYIFGVNPLSQSYVTGYGTTSVENPHHRFWANSVDSNYPSAPAGVLAGGPNSGLQDVYSSRVLDGCAPQKCYVDNISAWSVNEVTINWNAPLAWVTAYLDDYAKQSNY